jgi:MFS family permease
MRTTRLLIATRFIRSIGQGAMVVDFSLYLKALGWSAVAISLVLSVALAVGVGLTLFAGPLSDRHGRRVFLLGYEAAQAVAGVAALLTARPAVLATAAVIGGFGRGGNGAAGPFAPVEQAWLAQSVSAARRGPVYSVYAALGFFGMALGAGIAALPSRLQAMLPGALAYRPLFLIIVLASVACCGLLWLASDIEAGPKSGVPAEETPATVEIQKHENTLVRRLMIANLLNGVGIGATGPLIAYWFALRFGQGPGQIGPLLAGGFVTAGLASFATGWLTRQIGIVRAVVAMRLAGLAMLVALPFAPSFGLAGALYVLRGMLNRSTTGARSALNVSIVRPQRRGFAASMANVSLQAPRAVAPTLTGVLFGAGDLGLPFFIAAVFQGAYVAMYYWAFRNVDPRCGELRQRAKSHARD